ncbi:zinc finger BED domain-containing protein 4-like [Eupeodes corollae]|uniref:zinc finger BED domain-containing protein 4-like n=1 Tax=Eupeodes corollae TaxID=290404 RepID=UPI0024900665|nr:zinc finger BED domain-containing protein 4-like [Eupeodes corollae]
MDYQSMRQQKESLDPGHSANQKSQETICIDADSIPSTSLAVARTERRIVEAESSTHQESKSFIICFVYVCYLDGGSKWEKLTLSILFFISKDMRPFNVVEGEGFLKLMKEAAPLYKVPSSTFFKNKLAEKYDVTVLQYKNKIEKASDFCLTLDVWTETMQEKSFLGVTLHFFEGITPVNSNIATRELSQSHTAVYIQQVLEDIISDWNIPMEKIRCFVTDNGANMVAAIKNISAQQNKHLPCFPHTINLVVEAGIKHESVKSIITKIRTIVKWVKNSVKNSDKLRKLQIISGDSQGSTKKLVLDVCTRWNSCYYMIERFLELSKFCSDLLFDDCSSPEMPNSSEIEIIKQLVKLLKPFEYITKESSGEKYTSISQIIPMLNCLAKELLAFSSNVDCVKCVHKILYTELHRRFQNIEHNPNVALATLLDPRFKNLHFQDANACGRAIQKLKDLVKQDKEISSSESDVDETQKGFDFWKHHKELVISQKRKKNHTKSDSVSSYLSTPVSNLKSNPLEEWEDMKAFFPSLYKHARMFLVVVASSVPCERLFSKAGATISKSRNRLSGKHLEKLLFLSKYRYFSSDTQVGIDTFFRYRYRVQVLDTLQVSFHPY